LGSGYKRMNVLLLSQNHTIQEMFSLALRDMDQVQLDIVSELEAAEGSQYDLMFVDNALPDYQESVARAREMGMAHIWLLSRASEPADEQVDGQVDKPFLPVEIQEIVQQRITISPALVSEDEDSNKHIALTDEEKPTHKKKKKKKKREKKHTYKAETEVLNLDEIETIKALLEEDGLEIVHEEELAEKVLQERETAAEGDQQAALIEALRSMRPRRIRKLLKGATVRIEITFPETRS